MRDFAALATACPQARFVIDHHGSPSCIGGYAGRQEAVFADWRDAMRETAGLPNVVVKLSGFAQPLSGADFANRRRQPGGEDLRARAAPYFDVLIEAFGAERCMFASNFPIERTAISYRALWNGFKALAAGLPERDIGMLCGGTAERTYRLVDRSLLGLSRAIAIS
jgi:predicted TIM-barrel fold metal-dependent hydrolase